MKSFRKTVTMTLATFLLTIQVQAETVVFDIPETLPLKRPVLVVDKVPPLCEKILDIAEKAYFSIDPFPRYLGQAPSEQLQARDWHGFKSLEFIPTTLPTTDGSKPFFVYPFPASVAENTYLLSYSSTLSNVYAQQLKILQWKGALPEREPSEIPYTQAYFVDKVESPQGRVQRDSWFYSYSDIIPIEFDGQIYVISGDVHVTDVIQRFHIHHITPNSIDLVCQTATLPSTGGSFGPHLQNQLDDMEGVDAFRDLLKAVSFIVPQELESGLAEHILLRAFFRPWTMSRDQFALNSNWVQVDDILNSWKFQGIWEFRQYRAFDRARWEAIQQIASYYKKTMGWNQGEAGSAATNALILYTYHLIAGGNYLQSLRERDGTFDRPHWQLRKLLLEGREYAKIKALLYSPNLVDINGDRAKYGYYDDYYEPALFYALGSFRNMELVLEAGGDVNRTNRFGKTALMYAAHFDDYSSARWLLEHGAHIGFRTERIRERYSGWFRYTGRTALMYAVENGSPALVRLLLDAGADPTLRDIPAGTGNGRDIFDFLALNDKVSSDEIRQIERILKDAIAKRR